MNMKMLWKKRWGRNPAKSGSATNPFNELTLIQLYEIWSSTIAKGEEQKTDEAFERIKHFVEDEDLAKHPVHLVLALIRFTSTCTDYAFKCVEGRD
jgi:hypothetical protein